VDPRQVEDSEVVNKVINKEYTMLKAVLIIIALVAAALLAIAFIPTLMS